MANFQAFSRRQMLSGAGTLFAWSFAPKLARAEGRDPRLLVIVLRGALDGLAAVAPVGDPDWIGLRGNRALVLDGKTPALPLDSFFALNPAMPNVHRLFQARQAIVVHATATPYRERSHFDGQDVLENGLPKPATSESGWLNRALGALEPGARVATNAAGAFAVGPVTPLIARGPAPIIAWVPRRQAPPTDDTIARLLDIYRHTDPPLSQALENRIQLAALAKSGGMDGERPRAAALPGGAEALRANFAEPASAAAKYLAQPNGPRVGALSYLGWDTHINEGALGGQLSNLLSALDGAIAAIETGLGKAWSQTVVAVVTEFGRTARINGTDGTDHGTATIALLAGGALQGGRVIADWPGLKSANLHQGRDLKATIDLRAVMKGLLREHLRVERYALDTSVFPESSNVAPIDGLLT